MSAAPEPSTASRRWQRILAVLGVCLPIPLLAATGLSIPLPAPVERIAAALVPWADAATLAVNEALAPGARGSIVLLAGEGISGPAGATSAARDERLALGAPGGGGSGGGGGEKKTKDEGPRPGETEEPVKTGPGAEEPGKEPTDDPSLVEDTVEDTVKTVKDTADEVVETGNGLLEDVGGTVEETKATLDKTLGGLGN